jgi:hypothetical protein
VRAKKRGASRDVARLAPISPGTRYGLVLPLGEPDGVVDEPLDGGTVEPLVPVPFDVSLGEPDGVLMPPVLEPVVPLVPAPILLSPPKLPLPRVDDGCALVSLGLPVVLVPLAPGSTAVLPVDDPVVPVLPAEPAPAACANAAPPSASDAATVAALSHDVRLMHTSSR